MPCGVITMYIDGGTQREFVSVYIQFKVNTTNFKGFLCL